MKDDEVLRGVRVRNMPKAGSLLLNSFLGNWRLINNGDVRAASNKSRQFDELVQIYRARDTNSGAT
jgi:hypothetical protein